MKLITAEGIAELIGVSPRHVSERLSKQDGFPAAMRLGGLLRWDAIEIEQWIRNQRISPAARRSTRRTRGSRSSANSGQSGRASGPVREGQEPSKAA